jgi:putative glutamine amidotransferase
MIPTAANREMIEAYFEKVDGILLPGSPTDIDPARYGADRHAKLGRLYPERDFTDFVLLEFAEQRDLPLLGICFGIQSLNVYRGGSLIQDIPSLVPHSERHDEDAAAKISARHRIRIAENSLIERLAGTAELEVNSYHHQSVQNPGRNLRAVAFARDGVIEALEDTSGRFMIGVQWHPERGWQNDHFSMALFKAFIEEAGHAAESPSEANR